jgi:hypothetical protein
VKGAANTNCADPAEGAFPNALWDVEDGGRSCTPKLGDIKRQGNWTEYRAVRGQFCCRQLGEACPALKETKPLGATAEQANVPFNDFGREC